MKNTLIMSLSLSVLVSCTNTDKNKIALKSIKPDFLKIEHINQADGEIVNLETSDSSLLYDICRLDIQNDTFIVHSRDFLYTFSSSGKFIGPISRKGHARNEYTQISNVFFEEGIVGFYDFNKKTISRFDLKGRFISLQECNIQEECVSPVHVYPWDEGYIALNSYAGESTDRKALCALNKDLTSGRPIEGRSLSSGFWTSDDISIDMDGNVLYWELLCDTLFTVTNGNLIPLFSIDFGEHALLSDVTISDVYERMNYVNEAHERGEKFAGMARYYQRIDNMIYFSCLSPDNGVLLCQYNEDSGTSRLFTVDFDNQQYETGSFFLIKDNKLYWEIRDSVDLSLNPGLFVFNLNSWV